MRADSAETGTGAKPQILRIEFPPGCDTPEKCVAYEREVQGLPPTLEDPATIARLESILAGHFARQAEQAS
jgi:hypothetical protein